MIFYSLDQSSYKNTGFFLALLVDWNSFLGSGDIFQNAWSSVHCLTGSKCIQLQSQLLTGHSECSLNHSVMWLACPPCRHVWHHVNHLRVGLTLHCSTVSSTSVNKIVYNCVNYLGIFLIIFKVIMYIAKVSKLSSGKTWFAK